MVATTGMIADVVRWIGSDLIQLTQLIRAGVDPHLYKPIRDDVIEVLQAEVVFYNGLHLEGRMSELLELGHRSTSEPHQHRSAIAFASEIPELMLMGEPESHAMDPHVWMDVSLWSLTSHAVERELVQRFPDEQEPIRLRANQLRQRLNDLDRRGLEAIETIPPLQRILITSHDAFQYFGRRYGIEVHGIQGISTAAEAGLQRIPELIHLITSRSVPAVFHESSVGGKLVDALVEGTRAQGWRLEVGPSLYSDALGPEGSGADTYVGMMEHNFRTIATAMGGVWR